MENLDLVSKVHDIQSGHQSTIYYILCVVLRVGEGRLGMGRGI